MDMQNTTVPIKYFITIYILRLMEYFLCPQD